MPRQLALGFGQKVAERTVQGSLYKPCLAWSNHKVLGLAVVHDLYGMIAKVEK